uniref:Uncharacterized protein n=1 Tax=Haptolina brevifila TaxID=156173 RepID=A0A7S2GVU5_9EUKA
MVPSAHVVPTVVPLGLPVGPVQPPPPPPLTGLTADDRAAAAPAAVSDWAAACAPRKVSKSSWFGLGRKEVDAPTNSDELRMRVARPAEGEGIALEAVVSSDASMLQLAQRLAATSAAAPVAALRLTADDGYGPGTMAEVDAMSAGFALLTRCLMVTDGAGCLDALRELSISKITIGNEEAGQLATALTGHASLRSLELWNVGLEDEGALSIAQLATASGNTALSQLNLGRNLISGHGKELLEAMIDASRVHAKVY